MKKTVIMFLFIIMMTAFIYAQYVNVDFEEGGIGSDWEWTVGENGDNPPLEFIDNPVSGGINTTPKVAQFIARDSGQDWALCFTDNVGDFTFSSANTTFKIMIHKPVISNIGIKFEGTSQAAEILIPNSVTDQWEEIIFDFSAFSGNSYNRLVIIPDFAPRTQDNTIYFDNIQLPDGDYNPPTEPEIAAPTPEVPEDDVVSLYSNAYIDVPVDTWSAEWDQADVIDMQIEGNDTKLYTNLVFAGIEFTSQTIDASAVTNFYMDLWTPDDTSSPSVFKVKLVDFGADGVWGGGDDVEDELIFDENTMDSEVWISLDIPLSNFAGLITTGHLAQLIISGDPNTVYVDNIYFYDDDSGISEDNSNPLNSHYILGGNYPNPFNSVTTISYTLTKPGNVSLSIYDVKGRLVETLVEGNRIQDSYQETWDASNIASGIYFYRLSVDNKGIDTKRMILLK